jgi:hypothetical protein
MRETSSGGVATPLRLADHLSKGGAGGGGGRKRRGSKIFFGRSFEFGFNAP